MPLVAESRKHLSELVKGYSMLEKDAGFSYHFAQVTVVAGSDTNIDPIGTPIIWNDTDDEWNILANGDTVPTDATNLPNGAPMAITVGSAEGVGHNKADVTVGTGGTVLTVMFRGPAGIVKEGITYPSGVLSATQTVFEDQMEVQGIAIVPSADDVVPKFV